VQPHRSMIAGLVLGAVLGLLGSRFFASTALLDGIVRYGTEPVGRIFLRLLFMLVVPLLVSAIVLGIASIDVKQLGRLGLRLLAYTVVVSGVAVALGVGLVALIGPGRGVDRAALVAAQGNSNISAAETSLSMSPVDLIVGMVPDNPLRAAASGDMLALIVFSILFGVGLSATKTEAALRLQAFFQGLYDVSLTIIAGVLRLAPVGVFALLFTTTARLGLGALEPVLLYVGVVVLGLALQMFGVYSLILAVFCGKSPRQFFTEIREAVATAFATASSNATLPTALRVADEQLRLPKHVSRLVLTAGASMNQNGTALFEGVTVLFLAQAYGVEVTLVRQIAIVVICVLAGIGTAGVPAGSLPVIASILVMVGVPAEGIGLVLGVDRFLDMCRTSLNVVGDLVAAQFVARGEREP
jgi:dicarboxylate/amino acid:cation (Na+ or H+) symporter, DAACS family